MAGHVGLQAGVAADVVEGLEHAGVVFGAEELVQAVGGGGETCWVGSREKVVVAGFVGVGGGGGGWSWFAGFRGWRLERLRWMVRMLLLMMMLGGLV